MQIAIKKFHDLTTPELYKILQLRNAVFVVEQACVYQDCDDHDLSALHVMMWEEDTLATYARILPPGVKYPQVSIGRVVVHPDYRGKKLAHSLMKEAITTARKTFPTTPLMVQAQDYLQSFYGSLGFAAIAEPYDEDGIPHVDMVMN